jgi:hypothetical protein
MVPKVKIDLMKFHRDDSKGENFTEMIPKVKKPFSRNPNEIMSKDKICYPVQRIPSVVYYLTRRVPCHLFCTC